MALILTRSIRRQLTQFYCYSGMFELRACNIRAWNDVREPCLKMNDIMSIYLVICSVATH